MRTTSRGRRPVLILATAGAVFSPAGWFLIPPTGQDPQIIAYLAGAGTCMLGGMMWSGVELARFNLLLGFSESAGRSKFIAAAAVFLAGPGATFMTGQTIGPNGGSVMP